MLIKGKITKSNIPSYLRNSYILLMYASQWGIACQQRIWESVLCLYRVNFMVGKLCIIKLLKITKDKGWVDSSVGNLSSGPQHSEESWVWHHVSAILALGRQIPEPLVHQPGGMDGWVPCWMKDLVSKKVKSDWGSHLPDIYFWSPHACTST